MTEDRLDVPPLRVFSTFARTYVALARHGKTLFVIAWLPWFLGTTVFGLLAFDWLDVLPVLPLWQAQIVQAPFSAMIAVGVMRFVMLGVRPRRPFHLDCGKSVIRSSVILAVTALIAGPVDIVVSVEMRGFAAWALSNYLDVVPFASTWIPLATASLRWLLSTGLFATAYLLIGTTVAAAVGQRGLLRTVLGRHPFRTALFFFLLYLSMIPLKIVLVYVVFDIADWRLGDSGAELAGLIFLFSLISTKFSLLETVLPAVAVANLFGAKPRPS